MQEHITELSTLLSGLYKRNLRRTYIYERKFFVINLLTNMTQIAFFHT